MNTPTKKPVDWESIETAYCAGIIPLRQIAAMHGVTHTAINKRAKREGWIRDLTHKVEKRAKIIVLNAAAKAGFQNSKNGFQKTNGNPLETLETISAEIRAEKRAISEKKIVESAATLVAAVQIAHRGELAELRKKTTQYRESLTDAEQEGLPLKDCVDLLARLSSVIISTIKAEREAYGIDKGDVMKDEKDRAIRVEIVSPQAAVRVVTQ